MKYVIALLAFYCFMARADLEIKENYIPYTVSPLSKSLLLESLNQSSPIAQNGKVYHGHTAYQIKWRFWWKSSKNRCRLTTVKTSLNLIYTMPKLQTSAKDVQGVWSSWYPNLELHEKGHGNLAIDAAKNIDAKIISLGSFPSCSELEEAANAIGNKLMNELQEANENYDIGTNHGESQNAWLYQHL